MIKQKTLVEYTAWCKGRGARPQMANRSSRDKLVVSHGDTMDSLQLACGIVCRKMAFASMDNFTQYLVSCAVARLANCPDLVSEEDYDTVQLKCQKFAPFTDLLNEKKMFHPIRMSVSKMRLLAWDEEQAESIGGLLKYSGQYSRWVIQWFCCDVLSECTDILDPATIASLKAEVVNGRFSLRCYKVRTIDFILKDVM